MTQEIINIIIVTCFAFFLIATAIIINIVETKNVLNNEETDFISEAITRKKKALEKTGGVSFKVYCLMLIGFPLAVCAIGWLLMDNKLIVLVMALATVFLPDIISKSLRSKKDIKFESRYNKALNAFSSCLKSKMTIQQAVEDTAKNEFIHEEMREDFTHISSNLKLGIPTEEAFRKYADEKGSEDASDVASAISMQSVVGGGEAEIIDSISKNISKRIMVRREIKTLFASTDVLVTFMDFAPFVVILIMYFGAPMFVQPYFETTAMTLALIGILAFTVVGSFVIRVLISKTKKGNT